MLSSWSWSEEVSQSGLCPPAWSSYNSRTETPSCWSIWFWVYSELHNYPSNLFRTFLSPHPNEPICLRSCSFLSLSSWFWLFENSAQDSPGCPWTLQVALAGLKFATGHLLSLPSTGVSGVSHLAWHALLLFLGTLTCRGLLRSCFPSVWVSRHDLFTCSPPQLALSCAIPSIAPPAKGLKLVVV